MKKIVLVMFGFSILFSSCSNDENLTPLTELEKNDLLFLREEEKLARDIYIYAYTKYQNTVFNSISQSEQKHMDNVLSILNQYSIPDPASTQIGVFNNAALQSLYNQLKSQVDISASESLKVGATIEELDINDIDNFIANTSNSQLLNMYEKLNCGSKNHIRSFTSQIISSGNVFVPQYITVQEYNTILNSPSGSCK
jgi:hypothetical protein